MWIRDMGDRHLENAVRLLERTRQKRFDYFDASTPDYDSIPVNNCDLYEDPWEQLHSETDYFWLLGDLLVRGLRDPEELCDRQLALVTQTFVKHAPLWLGRDTQQEKPYETYQWVYEDAEYDDEEMVVATAWLRRQRWMQSVARQCDARGTPVQWIEGQPA